MSNNYNKPTPFTDKLLPNYSIKLFVYHYDKHVQLFYIRDVLLLESKNKKIKKKCLFGAVPVSIAQGCRSSGRGVVMSRSGWIAVVESRTRRCLDTGSQCQVLLIEPAQHASVPCTLMYRLDLTFASIFFFFFQK